MCSLLSAPFHLSRKYHKKNFFYSEQRVKDFENIARKNNLKSNLYKKKSLALIL